jgi:hypothetical protein
MQHHLTIILEIKAPDYQVKITNPNFILLLMIKEETPQN